MVAFLATVALLTVLCVPGTEAKANRFVRTGLILCDGKPIPYQKVELWDSDTWPDVDDFITDTLYFRVRNRCHMEDQPESCYRLATFYIWGKWYDNHEEKPVDSYNAANSDAPCDRKRRHCKPITKPFKICEEEED
ncbi:hypothetical protein DdX_17375 [Ditylenchus destructor]|uniref:Uncharacterized protein n=1 Tax=Ditylenchus destructor TaxID=166010 RepID=A0AAD4MP58_9BILA|nr:hypothetical protein DdX_17375 [Ditylenchus destructor]